MKNNLKTKVIIIVAIVIVTIVITILVGNRKSDKSTTIYRDSIRVISQKFYKDYLYKYYKSDLQSLANNNQSMSFSLYYMLNGAGIKDEKIKKTSFYKNCDMLKTQVTFYPKLPLSDENYNYSITLNCNK